jgi:hypothetical protein
MDLESSIDSQFAVDPQTMTHTQKLNIHLPREQWWFLALAPLLGCVGCTGCLSSKLGAERGSRRNGPDYGRGKPAVVHIAP